MSNFFKLWYRLARKNPELNNEKSKMTLEVGHFKSLMKKAYEQGVDDASTPDSVADNGLFGDLFGGFKS